MLWGCKTLCGVVTTTQVMSLHITRLYLRIKILRYINQTRVYQSCYKNNQSSLRSIYVLCYCSNHDFVYVTLISSFKFGIWHEETVQ